MLGDGLAGDVEMLRNGIGGHGLYGNQDEDGPSGGVCNGLEYVASHKYQLRSRSVANIRAANRFRKFIFEGTVGRFRDHLDNFDRLLNPVKFSSF